MLTALYAATLVILIFATLGIFQVAKPTRDRDMWLIVLYVLLINGFSYWLGVFID